MEDETEVRNFETWDWVLFAAMLSISAAIGIFYAIKDFLNKDANKTGEFLMGGRNMQLLPVAISILYLELRFQSKAAKLTGTILMIVQQGGMKAVVWTDVFQSVVMIAGILAIVIQGTLKVGSLGEVWRLNDDWGRIQFWEADPDPSVRHSVWSLVVGGAVGWMGTYGVNQASVQRYCAVGSLKESRCAVLLNIIGVIVLVTVTSLAGIVMFAYYAQKGCDPLTNENVENSNQLIPYFVMEVLGYPGLPGLFVSCLFSGALSTMSSCLNALSAVTWEDIVKPLVGHKVSESGKMWIIKLLVAFYGAAGVGFAFMAQNLGGTVLQASLSFTGAASGPLLGIFLLGALFPWANALGCVSGGILGLIFPLWISIGAYNLPSSGYSLDFPVDNCTGPGVNSSSTEIVELSGVDILYKVSYLWYPSIGVATVIIVGMTDIKDERDLEMTYENGVIVESSQQEDKKQPIVFIPSPGRDGIVQLSFKRRTDDAPTFAYTNGSFQNEWDAQPAGNPVSCTDMTSSPLPPPSPSPYEN
ncbi:Sodium-coupled monocarboxylate transporter 1 [Mactra antiquata]